MRSFPTHAATVTALAMLLIAGLAARCSLARLRHRVYVGDGGVREIQLWSRLHGVAVEHLLPLCLMLLLAEALGTPAAWIDLLGATILLARLVHIAARLARRTPLATAAMSLTYAIELGLPILVLVRLAAPK